MSGTLPKVPFVPYKTPNARKVRAMEYDMADFMDACVSTYCDLAKVKRGDLKVAHTPFIVENGRDYGLGIDMETEKDIQLDHEFTAAMCALRELLDCGSLPTRVGLEPREAKKTQRFPSSAVPACPERR